MPFRHRALLVTVVIASACGGISRRDGGTGAAPGPGDGGARDAGGERSRPEIPVEDVAVDPTRPPPPDGSVQDAGAAGEDSRITLQPSAETWELCENQGGALRIEQGTCAAESDVCYVSCLAPGGAPGICIPITTDGGLRDGGLRDGCGDIIPWCSIDGDTHTCLVQWCDSLMTPCVNTEERARICASPIAEWYDCPCSSSDDCSPTARCGEDGRCWPCFHDASCGFGSRCVDGRCVPPCTSDADCFSGLFCIDGRCTQCRSDAQCGPGFRCAGLHLGCVPE